MAITTLTPSTLLLLGLALVSVPGYSAQTRDWDLSPSLQLGIDYSNNLDLSASDKTETFIGTLTPGIAIRRQGRYLKLGTDYRLSLVEYSASTQSNRYFHNLNAFADAELVEDHLFVGTQATASQQLIDNSSAGSIDPRLAPDAFTNTLTFAFTPTWRQRIGDYTNISLSAGYDAVIYQTNAEDSEGFNYQLALDTRENPNKIYWTLETRQDSAKSSSGSNNLDRNDFAQVQLGYRHSRQLDLRIGGGYSDSHLDNPSDTDISDGSAFMSAGLTWTPNPRTSVVLNYSDQIQSNSRGVLITHRRKRGTLSLSLQQSLSSVRQQQLQAIAVGSLICPTGNSFTIADCRFINPGDSTIAGPNEQIIGINALTTSLDEGQFINEALNANYSYRFRKSTLSLGLTGNRRKFQDLSGRTEKDIGFNTGWALQLSRLSSITVTYDWTTLEPDTNAVSSIRDYRRRLNLGFNRSLSARTSVSSALRFNRLHSDDSSRNYEEYGASISLNHRF
ncbi:MAG: hypothetical protein ACJAWL_003263 [Motiliproteus sp.]|jgi:uncharacterized protein (PEP-CTERM system associated)